jgi:uncharacterized repeat protein (TIGR04042 family)
MPEIYMQIEWPDKKTDEVYSPSSVISGYFSPGEVLTLAEFEQKVVKALTEASGRVLARYGYECTSAMAEIQRLTTILHGMKDKTETIKIIHLSA